MISLSTAMAAPDLDLFGGLSGNEIFSGSTSTSTANGTDFGDVNVHDGVRIHHFTITNNGSTNLSVTGFTNSNPSQFEVSHFPTAPIPAGASDTFRIRFDPGSSGVHSATFTLVNNSTENPFSFRITGDGFIAPVINVEGRPDSGSPYEQFYDGDDTPEISEGTQFGATNVNTTVTRQFRIRNTGGATMTLISSENSPHFQIIGLASSIAAGASDTFSILFTPTTTGVLSATINIGSNSSNFPAFDFVVEGFGNGPDLNILGGPTLLNSIADGDTSASPTDGTDFGTLHINGGTRTNTFRARNVGNQNLIISSATITGADASHFTLAGLDGFIIQGGFDNFTVTFDPSSIGFKQAEVRIESTDPDESPYTFAIWGVGQGTPSFGLTGSGKEIENGSTEPSPTNLTLFADTAVGQSLSHDFVITNAGTDTLTLSPPAGAAHFSIAGLAASIPPGQSDTFTVNFTPATHGVLSRTISIASNDPDDNPFTFVVRGTGLAPAFFVSGGPTPPGLLISNGDSTPRTADGTHFGIVNTSVDTVSHTFRIPNTGNLPLSITKISLGGSHPGSFSIAPFDPEVPAGSTLDVVVTFAPTTDGLKTATLLIESSLAPYSFSISGNGLSSPDIRLQGGVDTSTLADIANGSTTTIASNGTLFPSTAAGTSAITRIRVYNDGNASMGINKSSSDPQFAPSGPANLNIAPGTFHTFDLVFTPTGAGLQTATITVLSNDPDESTYTFLVQGTGVAPEMAIFGGTMLTDEIPDGDTLPSTAKGTDFGFVNLNQSEVTRLFRIQNSGNATLIFQGLNISDPANYSLQFFFSTLAPMATGEFTITFHPTLPVGIKPATITLYSNDPDEAEYSFDVTGRAATVIDGPDLKVFGGSGFTVPVASGDVTPQTDNGTFFGIATVGDSPVTGTFQIRNTGTSDLLNVSVSSTHPDLSISGGNTSGLSTGKTRTFTATFTPTTAGFQTSLIKIASNDPNENPYFFAVTLDVKAPATSAPSIESFVIAGSGGTVEFIGNAGQIYRLTTSTTLANDWVLVPGTADVLANGSTQTIPFTVDPTGDPKRFYRLEEVP